MVSKADLNCHPAVSQFVVESQSGISSARSHASQRGILQTKTPAHSRRRRLRGGSNEQTCFAYGHYRARLGSRTTLRSVATPDWSVAPEVRVRARAFFRLPHWLAASQYPVRVLRNVTNTRLTDSQQTSARCLLGSYRKYRFRYYPEVEILAHRASGSACPKCSSISRRKS